MVVGRILNETVVTRWSDMIDPNVDRPPVIDEHLNQVALDFQILTKMDMPDPSKHSTFNISFWAYKTFTLFLGPYFNGTSGGCSTHGLVGEASCRNESDMVQHFSNIPDIPAWFARIATSLSASMRRNPAVYADALQTMNYTAPLYDGTSNT
jgi:hypothetical protein